MSGEWKRTALTCCLAFLFRGAALPAHAVDSVNAAPHPVVVVELFTSEGCSSCPPADALLRKINNTYTAEGQLIVGISEHVTYWNSLGWSDPYSAEVFTRRQEGYRARFRLESAYTPQMVVAGAEQIVGSDTVGLRRALEKQEHRPQIALRIASASVTQGELSISFSASGIAPAQETEIMAILADDADSSSVLRGENSGRTLTHVAVARLLARVAVLRGDADKSVKVLLPEKLLKAGQGGHHLILFAQAANQGAILGADTRPI